MVICWKQGSGFAYGPADATATSPSLASLKSTMVFTFLVQANPRCLGKEAAISK